MCSLFYPDASASVTIRFDKRNTFSLAALQAALKLAGIKTHFSSSPQDGLMIYSLATPQATEVYREIADSSTKSIYVAGGPHPTAKHEEALNYFDCVVLGEGEQTLPELVTVIRRGGDVRSVRGIAYKRGGRPHVTSPRTHVKLDEFPPFETNLRSPIEISRGCPHNCKYCQTPRIFGRKMRHRSVESVIFYSKYLTEIRFTSPNAFAYGSNGLCVQPSKVTRLLRSLQGNVYFGTFPSEVRPEFVTHELLQLVNDTCANTSIHIGAQSGSDTVLREVDRGHTRLDVELALDVCRDNGVTPVVDFIFGLPTETASDQFESLDLIDEIVKKKGRVRAHYFTPLPGTPYEKEIPVPISTEVNKRLGKLARVGHLSGRWESSKKGKPFKTDTT